MSEEALIPKMKRLDRKHKKMRIPINNFVLVILCTLLIIGATFVSVDIKHYIIPQGFSFDKSFSKEDFVYCFRIIPQIPILMFICSVLGKKLSVTCACLYVFLGLFVIPIFSLGGGVGYISEYSFGYIISFILGVYICGCFINKTYSFLNMFLGSVLGVLSIHICGIFYMIILTLIYNDGITFIKSWLVWQSGLKIFYDIVLSFVFILIGKYIHSFLKFLSD